MVICHSPAIVVPIRNAVFLSTHSLVPSPPHLTVFVLLCVFVCVRERGGTKELQRDRRKVQGVIECPAARALVSTLRDQVREPLQRQHRLGVNYIWSLFPRV